MKTPNKHRQWWILVVVLLAHGFVLLCGCQDTALGNSIRPVEYFRIQVVDEQTGRGVLLVELKTVNNIRYFTDSNGIIAFYEPGLMERDVFFFVESHGYEFAKDGFGFRGTILRPSAGGNTTIKIKRVNIAERLYRMTGQGIYCDSILTKQSVPVKEPLLNGLVLGQDSVQTCIYRGRLHWFWGDTSRPSYPLGNFSMSGATSELPGRGGLDPDVGVNLEYFVDDKGFSKKMCPMTEPGMVWMETPLTVVDKQGNERLIAKYARMKDLGVAYERGLLVYDDKTEQFERLARYDPNFLLVSDFGHPIRALVDGQSYYYFAAPFPLGVRMRVKADWDNVVDPNSYEIYTAPEPNGQARQDKKSRWIKAGELAGSEWSKRQSVRRALRQEKETACLYDIETGKQVSPHGGSVYWNAFRRRWIMIAVQQGGDSSFLGEVWYAEGDTPVGPWAYAKKIVTHNKYSFYNPKHHPYFDQDGGRLIYFEGTYSHTFSGEPANATPRYDYNQIMYRLSLDDRRLFLPVAVYPLRDRTGQVEYLMREEIDSDNKWEFVEENPFFAISPDRVYPGLIPVYASHIKTEKGAATILQAGSPSRAGDKPLFYAIAADDDAQNKQPPATTLLYEYRNDSTGEYLYSTNTDIRSESWTRTAKPICRVWKAPAGQFLFDIKARPAGY